MHWFTWTVPAVVAVAATATATAADPTPEEVFEKRLLPIFKSPNPSSCVQCHLAGVDLKDYILPSAEKTFRSLRDQGLIDVTDPAKSKILALIQMGREDAKTPAVHAATCKAGYEAFAAWIKACVSDSTYRASEKLAAAEHAKPPAPPEVIRHGRTDQLLAGFERTVWAMRFRCMNCHTEGTPQNDKLVKEHGAKVAWVKKGGVKATMDYLLSSKLVDPSAPEKSLLLQKPLGAVKHEGGVKFVVGDQGYQAFRTWIEDVGAVRAGRYKTAADLPKAEPGPSRFGTDTWFKLTDCPPAWGDKLLQVRLYAWDPAKRAWEDAPVATSDRLVAAKPRLWQHNLTLLAVPGSARARGWQSGRPALANGKYLAKVYVDQAGRLAKDWRAELGESDFVGDVEFDARWRDGYGGMTAASATKLLKP
jgi:hypothetical protein